MLDADRETMNEYGLVYDYANKGLVEAVQDLAVKLTITSCFYLSQCYYRRVVRDE